ncbi:hypothetical protein REPUB_Repub13aG0173700 [Reevesia pubescens]
MAAVISRVQLCTTHHPSTPDFPITPPSHSISATDHSAYPMLIIPSSSIVGDLLDYLNESWTQFHATAEAKRQLIASGFHLLNENDEWELKPGGRYFFTRNMSCLVAFAIGKKYVVGNGFHVITAHKDSPCLKLKRETYIYMRKRGWELCNDDGFIYKREKRHRVLTEPAPLPGDPEEEEKRRREWKRKNLLRVKEKYRKEIEEWKVLSNTLKAMQEKALRFQLQQQEKMELRETEEKQKTASCSGSEKKDNTSSSLVDELLLQAEAQEMIIRDVSNLCDISEAMCNTKEEQLKQYYFDLPIWASPRDLMASLCDE